MQRNSIWQTVASVLITMITISINILFLFIMFITWPNCHQSHIYIPACFRITLQSIQVKRCFARHRLSIDQLYKQNILYPLKSDMKKIMSDVQFLIKGSYWPKEVHQHFSVSLALSWKTLGPTLPIIQLYGVFFILFAWYSASPVCKAGSLSSHGDIGK